MANIASARKRARQTVKRTERNKMRRSRYRSSVRRVEEAVAAGDADAAAEALRVAQSELARASRRNVIHAKTASRKVSRLNARVRSLQG